MEYIEASERVLDHTPSNHRLGLPAIDVNGTRAIAEVPMIIDMRGIFRGVETDLTAHLRMLHRAERGADGWRLAASVAILEHDTMTPAIPGTAPTLTPDDLQGTRPPASLTRPARPGKCGRRIVRSRRSTGRRKRFEQRTRGDEVGIATVFWHFLTTT